MDFSEQVKQVRRSLYLSQEALANKLGVSFATINRWENGKSKPNLILEAKFNDFCTSNGIVFNK